MFSNKRPGQACSTPTPFTATISHAGLPKAPTAAHTPSSQEPGHDGPRLPPPRPVLGYRAAGAHLTTFPLFFLGAASRMRAGRGGAEQDQKATCERAWKPDLDVRIVLQCAPLVPAVIKFYRGRRHFFALPISRPRGLSSSPSSVSHERYEGIGTACCRV
ncbi:hypothetical protein LZ31DRAFT_3363 [Colletotrichum somersetense]|nr:hypothetical protein LZ31DRAFT_3363 [Colletotrichum somersetense]